MAGQPIRLPYLFTGIEMQAQTNNFARADRVTAVPFEHDPLDAFWAELEWQRNPPLLFMCSLDPETRAPIETEPYCLCTETQATHYGGVRECVLDGNILHLKLTRGAAKDLSIGPDLTVTLDVATGSIALLREGLRRVLACGPPRSRPKKLAI